MLSFRIDKLRVKDLICEYCSAYKLSQQQIQQLIKKIANFGKEEVNVMETSRAGSSTSSNNGDSEK